jgi:hypothetical protein
MTDIVTGTVIHYNPPDQTANPPKQAVFDPTRTKQITVDLPSGSDDSVAAVAIVSQYLLELKKEGEVAHMLKHATGGFVRVIRIQRTPIPPI